MTRLLEYLWAGLSTVLRHKLRSALTALGVVLAISALLTMLAVAQGARAELLKEMEQLGLRNILVTSRRPPTKTAQKSDEPQHEGITAFGLTHKDLARCRSVLPGLVRALPVHQIHHRAFLLGRRLNTRILGVTPEYFKTFPMRVNSGRMLSHLDSGKRARVCVLARPIPAEVLRGQDPLQQSLLIGEEVFNVVGVVTPCAKVLEVGASSDDKSNVLVVYIPFDTALYTYGTITQKWEEHKSESFKMELDQIIVECEDPLRALKPLQAVLKKGHPEPDYEISVPLEMLRQRQRTQEIFNLVLLMVASLTLLVGGIGIINIMLVSVAERTKEIGIRRALGAKRRDIMLQFLIETMALTMSGGLLGVLLGFAGVQGIEAYTGWPATVTATAVIGSFLVSVAAGVVFGLYPAYKAAGVMPVVALRYE